MSTTDRDAMERDALAEDLHGDCYEGLDLAAKREVDRLLAAGWSRSPRPAAVSDEAVEAAARALWAEWNGDGAPSWLRTNEASRVDTRNVARAALTAALPHLAPGQNEAEFVRVETAEKYRLRAEQAERDEQAIRADERAKVAERIEKAKEVWEQGWTTSESPSTALGQHGLWMGARAFEKAARVAGTAPAEDGAE